MRKKILLASLLFSLQGFCSEFGLSQDHITENQQTANNFQNILSFQENLHAVFENLDDSYQFINASVEKRNTKQPLNQMIRGLKTLFQEKGQLKEGDVKALEEIIEKSVSELEDQGNHVAEPTDKTQNDTLIQQKTIQITPAQKSLHIEQFIVARCQAFNVYDKEKLEELNKKITDALNPKIEDYNIPWDQEPENNAKFLSLLHGDERDQKKILEFFNNLSVDQLCCSNWIYQDYKASLPELCLTQQQYLLFLLSLKALSAKLSKSQWSAFVKKLFSNISAEISDKTLAFPEGFPGLEAYLRKLFGTGTISFSSEIFSSLDGYPEWVKCFYKQLFFLSQKQTWDVIDNLLRKTEQNQQINVEDMPIYQSFFPKYFLDRSGQYIYTSQPINTLSRCLYKFCQICELLKFCCVDIPIQFFLNSSMLVFTPGQICGLSLFWDPCLAILVEKVIPYYFPSLGTAILVGDTCLFMYFSIYNLINSFDRKIIRSQFVDKVLQSCLGWLRSPIVSCLEILGYFYFPILDIAATSTLPLFIPSYGNLLNNIARGFYTNIRCILLTLDLLSLLFIRV